MITSNSEILLLENMLWNFTWFVNFFFFTAQYLTKTVAYGLRVPCNIFKENKSSCTVFPLIIFGTKKSLRLTELSIKKTIKKKQPSLYNIFWKCIWYSHLFPFSVPLNSKGLKPELIAAESLTFYTQKCTEFMCAHPEIKIRFVFETLK